MSSKQVLTNMRAAVLLSLVYDNASDAHKTVSCQLDRLMVNRYNMTADRF